MGGGINQPAESFIINSYMIHVGLPDYAGIIFSIYIIRGTVDLRLCNACICNVSKNTWSEGNWYQLPRNYITN